MTCFVSSNAILFIIYIVQVIEHFSLPKITKNESKINRWLWALSYTIFLIDSAIALLIFNSFSVLEEFNVRHHFSAHKPEGFSKVDYLGFWSVNWCSHPQFQNVDSGYITRVMAVSYWEFLVWLHSSWAPFSHLHHIFSCERLEEKIAVDRWGERIHWSTTHTRRRNVRGQPWFGSLNITSSG